MLGVVQTRAREHKHVLFDTPGQIEVFTWSASGAIITETLACELPTVIVYVLDTPRCNSAITFVSNMLYACSILYKSKLPFVLAFNKIDVVDHNFALDWMADSELVRLALEEDASYAASLAKSMATTLHEFYNCLRAVGVSAYTGAGMDELFDAIDDATRQYHVEYAPLLQQMRKHKV